MKMTPQVGTRGIYQLKSPYVALPTKTYTCYAIRSFKDIYELGEDVYTKYYTPHSIDEVTFESDVDENASIITLMSEDNETIYVPDTYILSFPDMGIVNYQRVILSIDFGMLPDYLDLDYVRDQLSTSGSEVIGKNPDIDLHIAPTTGVVTSDEHQTLEASRLANVEFRKTTHANYLEQLKISSDLIEKVQTLEQIIITNGLLNP
jgi:hypothetical protein